MEDIYLSDMNVNQAGCRLPMIPLRGVVVFPNTVVTIDVGRERSLNAVQTAMNGDHRIFLVAQRDALVDHPEVDDVHTVGTLAYIRQVVPMPDHTLRVLVDGKVRALLLKLYEGTDYQEAEIAAIEDPDDEVTLEEKAMMRVSARLAKQVANGRNGSFSELLQALNGEKDPNTFCDVCGAGLLQEVDKRQELLADLDRGERMKRLLRYLSEEVEIAELDEKIQARVHEFMEKSNHDYYLREQIHAIQDELGEDEDEDITELRKKLSASKMPKEAREKVEKELKRLARTAIQAPESAIGQNYIEYMLDLPWGVYDESVTDIAKARKIFDEDHFGMREVKDRLIEFLAVRAHAKTLKSPIICLVGPPGVGKTSIAKSVARALDRKFVQLSLGGVHDEAEIRGHRKTYVGAMPGRIMSAIDQAKTMNPVFLLDEIDKMARDMRGDPASAMLEVLDPEQNKAFRDHYVEVPFDLSDVLFITTANSTAPIDRALLDRMEVIEVPSYTLEEKVQISKKHLIPKQLAGHGLKRTQLRISDKVLTELIDRYTREAGVRTLEREIGKVCRKVTLRIVEDPEIKSVTVKAGDLEKYLGSHTYIRQSVSSKAEIGTVNGLAWTSVGGEVMPIEVETYAGKGGLELTGSLGDVMKESARIARSVARKRLKAFDLPEDYFDTHDIHIHVPEGAVPKDGPSAGVALTCALLSAITGRSARADVAMTGEIGLHGKVMPIGGVREKLLAAYRMGIFNILLPEENRKDLKDIDAEILEKFDISFPKTVDEAAAIVLEGAHADQKE